MVLMTDTYIDCISTSGTLRVPMNSVITASHMDRTAAGGYPEITLTTSGHTVTDTLMSTVR